VERLVCGDAATAPAGAWMCKPLQKASTVEVFEERETGSKTSRQ
jgi:hypothetical protein